MPGVYLAATLDGVTVYSVDRSAVGHRPVVLVCSWLIQPLLRHLNVSRLVAGVSEDAADLFLQDQQHTYKATATPTIGNILRLRGCRADHSRYVSHPFSTERPCLSFIHFQSFRTETKGVRGSRKPHGIPAVAMNRPGIDKRANDRCARVT